MKMKHLIVPIITLIKLNTLSKKRFLRDFRRLSWIAQIERNHRDNAGSEATCIEAFPLIENSNMEKRIYI